MTGAWRLAVRNLSRNRRRNFATASAIALGFAGLLLAGGYVIRAERDLRAVTVYLQHVGHVSIYKEGGLERAAVKPSQFTLTADEQETISTALRADPRVERVAKYLKVIGLATNGCKTVPFVASGLDPDVDHWTRTYPEVLARVPQIARPQKGVDLLEGTAVDGALSLSTGLARLLDKPLVASDIHGEPPPAGVPDCQAPTTAARLASNADLQLVGTTFDGAFSAVDGTVVSVHTTGAADLENSSVLAPLHLLQRLADSDHVTYMAVYLKDPGNVSAYAREVEQTLRAQGLSVSVYPYTDERVSMYYVGMLGFLLAIAGFIFLVVAGVVVLSIANSTTMTVLERTREIGAFRSLGFTRSNMVRLFIREGIALTAIGVAVGASLALAAAGVVNALDIHYAPPGIPGDVQFRIDPNPTLCVILAAAMVLLSCVAVFLAVRGRVGRPIADLNTAVSG